MSVWCWFYLQVTTMVYTFNCDMCNYRCETTTNAAIYISHVTVCNRLSTCFHMKCQVYQGFAGKKMCMI